MKDWAAVALKATVFIGVFVALLALSLRFHAAASAVEVEHVTLHHLYVLDSQRITLVANPEIVWGDGFACKGDDKLLRTELTRDEETGLLLLVCFWSQEL